MAIHPAEHQPGFLMQLARRGDADGPRQRGRRLAFEAGAGEGGQLAQRQGAMVGAVDPAAGEDHDIRHEAVAGVADAHQHLHPARAGPPQQQAGGVARMHRAWCGTTDLGDAAGIVVGRALGRAGGISQAKDLAA